MWVDIRYFEGRLIGAQAYMKANKTDEAYNTLAEALNIGIRIEYAEAVKEYADAAHYLVLATNQAEAGDVKGAAKNLKKARKSPIGDGMHEAILDITDTGGPYSDPGPPATKHENPSGLPGLSYK